MLRLKRLGACLFAASAVIAAAGPAAAQKNLAKQSQNPLASVISVPFENNTYYGVGPSDATVNVLNLKPVVPINLGAVNLINRVIAPIIYTEGQSVEDLLGLAPANFELGVAGVEFFPSVGSEFGLGDTTYQLFITPSAASPIIFGAGPAIVLPTATADRFASDKWSAGPTAVALAMPGNWVLGVLAQNVWSFAGDSDAPEVNQFLLQYFLNYNLDNGWYLTSAPNITANWTADSDQRWTVPFGGGVGKLVKIGNQPVDFKLAGYWNAEKPDNAPDWSSQFTVKFLFPQK